VQTREERARVSNVCLLRAQRKPQRCTAELLEAHAHCGDDGGGDLAKQGRAIARGREISRAVLPRIVDVREPRVEQLCGLCGLCRAELLGAHLFQPFGTRGLALACRLAGSSALCGGLSAWALRSGDRRSCFARCALRLERRALAVAERAESLLDLRVGKCGRPAVLGLALHCARKMSRTLMPRRRGCAGGGAPPSAV
jgi:hypothetical protein